MVTLDTVPGGPGRSELMSVRSEGGLQVHLLDKQAGQVLCQGLRTGTVRIGPTPPFEHLGCRRCIRAAVKAGYTEIITDDGPLDLAELLTRPR